MAHEFRLRVYFEDTDAAGVVYYGNYLKFMERARSQWFLECSKGMRYLMKHHELVFVVSRTELNYKRSAKLEDEIVVITEIKSLGRATIAFSQAAYRDSTFLCDSLTKVGCVCTKTLRPKAIPADIYQDLVTLLPATQ